MPRLNLLGPQAHALNPSLWAHMTRRTAVDQQKLSAVVDPHLRIPHSTNTHQWGDGSSCRAQLNFLASKDHFVAICHQHLHRQNRVSHIDNSNRHMSCACNRRRSNLENTISIQCQSVSTGCSQSDGTHLRTDARVQICLWCHAFPQTSSSISPHVDPAACCAHQFVQYASQSSLQKHLSLSHLRHSWLGMVYLYLSSSSNEHHLLHSCLGTGMRVGTYNKFCHYRASLVHSASSIVFLLFLVCWWEQYHDTATSGADHSDLRNHDNLCRI